MVVILFFTLILCRAACIELLRNLTEHRRPYLFVWWPFRTVLSFYDMAFLLVLLNKQRMYFCLVRDEMLVFFWALACLGRCLWNQLSESAWIPCHFRLSRILSWFLNLLKWKIINDRTQRWLWDCSFWFDVYITGALNSFHSLIVGYRLSHQILLEPSTIFRTLHIDNWLNFRTDVGAVSLSLDNGL